MKGSNRAEVSDVTDKQAFARLTAYFKPHRAALLLALLGALIVGAANAMVAPVVKVLMDLFSGISQSLAADIPLQIRFNQVFGNWTLYDFSVAGYDQAKRLLVLLALAAVIIVVVKGGVHFGKEFLLWRVTHKVLMQIKHQLFNRILAMPMSLFDREKTGDMVARVTYDVTQVESAIRSGINMTKALIYALIYISAMFVMEWSLTLLALAVFPLSAVLIKLFGDRVRRVSRLVSQNVADYTAYLAEAIAGAKVIKAFNRQRDIESEFSGKIRDNYRFSMKIARLNSLHAPSQEIFSTLGLAVVIIFCGLRMLAGKMTVGDLSGFLVLLTNAYKPIKDLGEANAVIQRAIASGRRIFSLMDQPDEARTIPSGTYRPSKVSGSLTFDSVAFSYNGGEAVLKDINLALTAGETLALVGPSGGGKSTLVNLIPRFYPITSGRILLDERDTSEWDLNYLRSVMAIVPQETVLFSGSVYDNIRMGKPSATEEEVVRAAKAANAHEFIISFTSGYDSEVGERGMQLSGGQRQRIAIARAVLRDPRILLLDEATSALDSVSERLIQEALDRFRRDRTTIVIAHRLSTVQKADRIAVMSAGRIVEIGTHKSLYQHGGEYRRLCEQQLA